MMRVCAFTLVLVSSVALAFTGQPRVSTDPGPFLTAPGGYVSTRGGLIYGQELGTALILMTSQDDSNVPFESRVADDFEIDDGGTLAEVEWWGGYFNGTGSFTSAKIEIYADDDGPDGDPGTGALWAVNIPYADCDETYVGSLGNGEVYKYHVVLDNEDYFSLDAGTTYWLCIQLVMDYPPQAGVVGQEQTVGSGVYFVSEYFGFPDWVEGWQVFLDDYDCAFNLYGPSDNVPPTITDTYPHDDGVPADTWIGFHVQDDSSGCDTDATTCVAEVDGTPITWADVHIDDTDPLDVAFDYEPAEPFANGDEVQVTAETYDLAGNGPVTEQWTFVVGYTNVTPASVGFIKAEFAN